MLGPFNRPIQSQAHFTFGGQLPQGLGPHRVGQAVGGQPGVMQQARQAFEGCLLIAQAAGQLGLIPRLFLNDRAHKGGDPFELVAMCPGEHVRDILLKASSPRVLGCHKPRLARVYSRGYSPPNECVLTSDLKEKFPGGQRGSQALAKGRDGRRYDVIEWIRADGTPVRVCFDIDQLIGNYDSLQ